VLIALAIAGGLIVAVLMYDLTQRKHAILRNFPIIGHFRYMLEAVGPELRQYIVTDNNEERPFNRDERRWVYASAKKENNYFGFGSDQDMELASNYVIINHSAFPLYDPHPGEPGYDPDFNLPAAKVIGLHRNRRRQFRPASVINISGMSFGALSGPAVEALNKGARLCGCLQNTGEGGVSRHHLMGGELIWQIGTGYFGCRASDGMFSFDKLIETVESTPAIRAIEIKLSQGAKPGVGGMLPAAKVSAEIAAARGVPRGRDCISPPTHSAFSDVTTLLEFIERVADGTGLPVGIKSAVGDMGFWRLLGDRILDTGMAPDFVTIDGGEGGTGAGPLVFSDHVSLPWKIGFSRVFLEFSRRGLDERIVFIGSGKLGLPAPALLAFALGCDMVNVGREAMLAIGCIQAQRCHTGHCPTGITTHNRWLTRGLDPGSKAERLANYVITLRRELLRLSRACGVEHPSLIGADRIEILDGRFGAETAERVFGYPPGLGVPSEAERATVAAIMASAGNRTSH
jgi:glutamate synthase domain-containing protein 2